MTSQEMFKETAGEGYRFVNIAKNGDEPNWQRQVEPYSTKGKLFGYDEKSFMARQYR